MKNKVNMYFFENKYRLQGFKSILGLDEAGRGAWAGPIVVAGVILPNDYRNSQINDSKKIAIKKRYLLFNEIIDHAIDYKIIFIDAPEVDELNPKQASINGMKEVIRQLKHKPDICLIDAEKIDAVVKTESIIKGDAKSISIAAASILAKVARDRFMTKMDKLYPQYDFSLHKGYGTLLHLKKLKTYGPIEGFHRFSYKPVKMYVKSKKDK